MESGFDMHVCRHIESSMPLVLSDANVMFIVLYAKLYGGESSSFV